MSRQEQRIKMYHIIAPISNTTEIWDIVDALIDAGFGDKDRFEYRWGYGAENSKMLLGIKPIDYKEQ